MVDGGRGASSISDRSGRRARWMGSPAARPARARAVYAGRTRS